MLSVFRNGDKKKLDAILKKESKFNLNNRLKSYPVLWHKPDIFHLQWVKGIADWMWVKAFGIKLVVSLRGAHINYSPLANKALATTYSKNFPAVDGFHAVSNAIMLEAKKYKLDENKTAIIYSGIHVNSVSLKPYQRKKRTTILSVGRSHWKKGYTYALDVFKILLNQNFQFKYTIVGGVNLELKYQIKELGLDPYVNVIEQVSFDEVQRLIKTSNLLLLPSHALFALIMLAIVSHP